jgi:hypothetical protein
LFAPDANFLESYLDEHDEPVPAIPKATVAILSVSRGRVGPGDSCEDAGTITVRITWPRNSAYALNDMGFYFRVAAGNLPDGAIPLEPITPIRVDGQRTEFLFPWLDVEPAKQKPLRFRLEVIPVNKGLQLGPSTFVETR